MINPFVSSTYSLPVFPCTVLYLRLTELRFWLTFFPVFMHLFVYARHQANCSKKSDRFWRRCRCPKWIRGILDGKSVRVAAWTTDWEVAEAKAREMEQPLYPQTKVAQFAPAEVKEKPQRITIEEAVEAFLDDEQGRQLKRSNTFGQKRLPMECRCFIVKACVKAHKRGVHAGIGTYGYLEMRILPDSNFGSHIIHQLRIQVKDREVAGRRGFCIPVNFVGLKQH